MEASESKVATGFGPRLDEMAQPKTTGGFYLLSPHHWFLKRSESFEFCAKQKSACTSNAQS
jgi:hypothetical protein